MAQKASPKTKTAATKKKLTTMAKKAAAPTKKVSAAKSAPIAANRKPVSSKQLKPSPIKLSEKTRVELMEAAKSSGVHVTTRMTKDEIIKAMKKR